MLKLAEKQDSNIKKVGTKGSNGKFINYRDVEADDDGWVNANLFLPPDYELCYLKTSEKTISGWHITSGWDGHRLLSTDNVLYWKRNADYNNECSYNGRKQR